MKRFLVAFTGILLCLLLVANVLAGQDSLVPFDSSQINTQADSIITTSDSAVAGTDTATGNTNTSVPSGHDTTATADTTIQENAGSSPGEDTGIALIRELISFRKIAVSVFVILFTYFFTNIIARLFDTFSERFSSYRLFIKRLVPITRVFIWIVAIYIILAGIIAPPLETIITIMASVGIAVGFASQDILKNIFGGIMIILDRPFQVGDKIELGNHYGEVTQIGLRSCRMVTPDDSIVAIPNAEIMNKAVSNANSGALYCQVVAEIFLPADVDLKKVKKIAMKAAYSSRYVYLKKPVMVIAVNEIHEKQFVLKLRVKAYVLDIRYEFPFKSDMTEIILDEVNRLKLIK